MCIHTTKKKRSHIVMSDPPLATKIPAYMICIAKNNQRKQSQAEETLTDHKLSHDGKTIN